MNKMIVVDAGLHDRLMAAKRSTGLTLRVLVSRAVTDYLDRLESRGAYVVLDDEDFLRGVDEALKGMGG